jgi:penicillin-binding protein 1B
VQTAAFLPSAADRIRAWIREGMRLIREHPRLRRALLALAAIGVAGFGFLVWLLFPYLRVWGDIGAGPENAPSRLYALPHLLSVGDACAADDLAEELETLSYHPYEADSLPPGRYRVTDDNIFVHLRRRLTPFGTAPTQLLWIQLEDDRIVALRLDGQPVERAALEAPILATYYTDEQRERWPVRLRQLPEHLVQSVLAAEDASFYWHPGVSPTGIARAALANLRKGTVTQGGSTLTQQLVKNVFLSQERTFFRKVREATIALAVEAQHSKRAILQAYFNGIYLGGSEGIQFYGFGAAARAYFGKDASELTLEESATLAGMIKTPASYSPLRNPERSRKRRDEVLRRMAELGFITPARLAQALATPLETSPMKLGARRAAHFADAVAREARERYGLKRLGNRGYQIFATLSLRDQGLAEQAVREELDRLDRRGRQGGDPLEVALVSVDPRSGAYLAYVGGRDFERSEFDRVAQAKRQAGSCFKPIVLVAALETGKASPATQLHDEPLTLRAGGEDWTPKNSDGEFRGIVTARMALEKSINVPLVRLGMAVGLDQVAATAHRLGIEQDLVPVPALALGAADVTPREVATVYSTLASGGIRPVLHGIERVLGSDGKPLLEEKGWKKPLRVLTPQVAYVATSVLQGVVERGTAAGVLRYGIPGPLAGKTGTTNESRDSWFAGYRPDRVTVVWVGHDNSEATNLSGSRAALPIWGRYMRASLPSTKGPDFVEPDGLEHATVCRESGLRARPLCPAIREVFLKGQAPGAYCDLPHEPKILEAQQEFGVQFGQWLKKRLLGILKPHGDEPGEKEDGEKPPP